VGAQQRGMQADSADAQSRHGHHYVVAIGIDRCENWPILTTAESDAAGFAERPGSRSGLSSTVVAKGLIEAASLFQKSCDLGASRVCGPGRPVRDGRGIEQRCGEGAQSVQARLRGSALRPSRVRAFEGAAAPARSALRKGSLSSPRASRYLQGTMSGGSVAGYLPKTISFAVIMPGLWVPRARRMSPTLIWSKRAEAASAK
jgi:hypothetical protein